MITTQQEKVEEFYEKYSGFIATSVTGQESKVKGSKRQVVLYLRRMEDTVRAMRSAGVPESETREYERYIGKMYFKISDLHEVARGKRLGLPFVEYYDDEYELVYHAVLSPLQVSSRIFFPYGCN
jgi:hypothetical protein